MIIDRPLEKQSGRNQQGYNADAAEDLRADAVFERSLGLGKVPGKVRDRHVLCATSWCGRRSRGLPESHRRLRAQFSKLSFQRFDSRGQGGKVRSNLSFLGWLLLLLVRDHGNYFTAILSRVVQNSFN